MCAYMHHVRCTICEVHNGGTKEQNQQFNNKRTLTETQCKDAYAII
jgi:hypothetical protein